MSYTNEIISHCQRNDADCPYSVHLGLQILEEKTGAVVYPQNILEQ